jgi:alkyl hydroperoxide reductase subunit AhpF
MALLSSADQQTVRGALADMRSSVRLLFFQQTFDCETCLPTRQILDELAALSDKIVVEEVNFVLDREKAGQYRIDRVPGIVVLRGEEDTGIRFFGAPAGYEFTSLIDAIVLASGGDIELSHDSRTRAAAVAEPLAIQVFVTPT